MEKFYGVLAVVLIVSVVGFWSLRKDYKHEKLNEMQGM